MAHSSMESNVRTCPKTNTYFTADEEIQLIELVGKHTCLYNMDEEKYRDADLRRNNAWIQIGKELKKDPDVCKNKFNYFREFYFRKKRAGPLPMCGNFMRETREADLLARLKYLDPEPEDVKPIVDDGEDVEIRISDLIKIAAFPEIRSSCWTRNAHSSTSTETSSPEVSSTPPAKRFCGKPVPAQAHSNPCVTTVAFKPDRPANTNEKGSPIADFMLGMTSTIEKLPLQLQIKAKRQICTFVLDLEEEASKLEST